MNSPSKTKKSQHIPISVLDLPPKNHLMQINTNNSQTQYILYKLSDKKVSIEGYKIFVENSKVFPNIQIYKWRRLTQFPISKTYFVNIKSKNLQYSNITELMVYIEHCPLELDSLTQISLPQVIYFLKEALFGYNILFNKFGQSFHISSRMIRFNEKGYCKVWINQNFGLNTFTKVQKNQSGMLINLLEIIQNHYDQIKGKKLFTKLKQCKTFLGALKQLDFYTNSFKIIVPNRLVDNQTQRSSSPETPKLLKLNLNRNKKESIYSQNNRNSIIQNNGQDINGSLKLRQPTSLQKPLQIRTQQTIKKIKSSESLALNAPHHLTHNTVYSIPINNETSPKKNKFGSSIMKVSHETSYTRNINKPRCFNVYQNYNSPRQNNVNDRKITQNQENMCQSDRYVTGKFNQKKDLSYSQVPINPEDKKLNKINQNRSSSTKKNKANTTINLNQNLDNSFTIGNKSSKVGNIKNSKFCDQFMNVLSDDIPKTPPNKPKRQSQLQYQDQQQKIVRASHTNSVMRNNGWKFNGVLEVPKELNESFQEGCEQNAYIKSIELKKLDSLGKRAITVSLLPDEYQQVV